MKKELLPYSHLVLYAKGWIKFQWIKETDYYRELKIVLTMCGYTIFSEEEVLNHVLNAVDRLKEVYSKNGIAFIHGLNSYLELIEGSKRYQRLYDIKTFELAMILYCLSCLRQLDLRGINCIVYNIDYRLYKIKIRYSEESMTYKECQNKFREAFKDMLSTGSYEYQWWIKDLKLIR